MPKAANEEIADIIDATRIVSQGKILVENGDHAVFAENSRYVEPNFFEFFNFPLVNGSDTAKFNAPRKVILSQEMADRAFKKESALGKILKIQEEDWEVVGVIEKNDLKSHLNIDILLSLYLTEADSSFNCVFECMGWTWNVGIYQIEKSFKLF